MFETDYVLTGKHANIVKFFVNNAGTFPRYIDVYNCAAIFGLLYDTTAPKDNTEKGNASILADVFIRNRADCVLIYRLVMLLEKKSGLTTQERIDRAFRDDADEGNPERLEKNLELFNSYVRGGLEVMKERFLDGCTSDDDYLRQAYSRFKDFKDQVNNVAAEDPLAQLL